MKLTLDNNTRKVSGDAESLSKSSYGLLKLSRAEVLSVKTITGSSSFALSAGDDLSLVLKQWNGYESTLLQSVSLTTANLASGRYTKTFSTYTQPILDLLEVDAAGTGVSYKTVLAALVYTASGADPWESDEFYVRIYNAVLQDDDLTPDSVTQIYPSTAPSAGRVLVGNAGGTAYAAVSISGDATLASTGALTIAADAVTNAKAANMAQATIKGRAAGAGTGDQTDLTPDQASTILDSATDPFLRTSNSGAAAGSTGQVQYNNAGSLGADAGMNYAAGVLFLGQENVQAGQIVLYDNVGSASGSILFHDQSGGNLAQLTTGGITGTRTATLPDASGEIVLKDNTATLTGKTINGPDNTLTNIGTSSLSDGAVTLAKMANLAQDQFIGRTTASTGIPQTATITAAARTVLDDTTVSAMVDTLGGASATGTGGLVRATSPTLVTPALGTPSSVTLTNGTGLPPSGITMATSRLVGRTTASAGAGEEISVGDGLSLAAGVLSSKVLQVVIVTPKTDTASGTDAAPTWGTAYSGSITTLSASSKVIVICSAQIGVTNAYGAFARLERSGTPLVQGDAASSRIRAQAFISVTAGGRTMLPTTLVASDSPGSAASHTYSLTLAVESGGTWYLNRSPDDNDAAHIGRGATTMFLIEVA